MTELTGKQIASTYKQLLKIGVSTNTGVTDTLQTVQSGDGTNSALQIATGKVAILGELSVSEDFSIGNLKVNKINVSACISATNLVAATGSFTTKVSGVAGEFSGTVCAATFDGALTGDVTGDIDGATGSFSACISATNLVAATGSFTTKVSGVAGEFSGTVCAATFDGALTGDVTGDIDGATGSFSACISATNLVAATGSFTTKVSGVAAEFSGNVCAAEFYGGGANITGITHPTSVAAMTINTLGVVTAASITSLVAPHGSFTTKVSGVAGEFSGTVCAATFDGALTGNVTGDIDGATGSFSACISATNLVAATGSFTTKVSGVAGEFSGTVCAATFDGALTGDVTGNVTGDVTGDIDGAIGSFSACISATNLVAATGSFTTKVSGVAGEFSGTVCAATFDGALTGNVTGDIDGAVGSFSACISATNIVAATGSFTTKVSGVASEFSGNVCAAEFYGGGANITGISGATSVTSFTVNQLAVVTVATFADGLVGTPSFTNTGDTNTGIFFSAADKLNISSGGVEVAELGTTGTEIVFNDGGVDIDFRIEGDTNANLLHVNAGSNSVGIGTNESSDLEMLEVRDGTSTGTTYDLIRLGGGGNKSVIQRMYQSVSTSAVTIATETQLGSGGGMTFVTGGTSPNQFSELVVWCVSGGTPAVVGSVEQGSPSARTYSQSGVNLQVAIGTGTIDMNVTTLWHRT
jgi:hypothetical protein